MTTSKINYCIVSFEVLRTAVTAANRVSYNVMSCSLTEVHRHFGETYCPHRLDRLKKEAAYLKEVPPKIQQISNRLHDVKSQKKVFSEK
jgi:hypothetical protein